MNTGFGGSADTRTNNIYGLQRTQTLQCGIIAIPRAIKHNLQDRHHGNESSKSIALLSDALPNADLLSNSSMPEAWVRAAILIRANSLASGNSSVRTVLIESLVGLLQKDIAPLIPLRGSISASGDLSPLSYVEGTLQGSPGVNV